MKTTVQRILSFVMALCMMIGVVNLGLITPAEAATSASDQKIYLNKEATELNGTFTNVTLTVGGQVESYIDVVFVLGGGMTANRKTVDSALNVFKPLMESGKSTVRMGIISLEKGEEIILDLNSPEAVLNPATYEEFITEKFDYMNTLPAGSTNLHSQLVEAKKMLDKEPLAKSENKYVFVIATGRTYWFDDANGNQAMIANKVNGTYYWGNYLWQSQRGRHTSLYMIPDRYNDSYDAFMADIETWVAADGDTYVYSPMFDSSDIYAYSNWYNNNNQDLRALGIAGSRYGLGWVTPAPTAENFFTGVPAAIGSENHPEHALNYERAQYESAQAYKALVDADYNCYAICSENPNYQNGSEYIKQGAKYTGTSTIQLGHSFMNYLARLGNQTEAPTVWDYTRDAAGNIVSTATVLQEDFFTPIAEDLLYSLTKGSYIKDYIGFDADPTVGYDFDFVEDESKLILKVGATQYIAERLETPVSGATSSYAFTAPGAEEATFTVDYYRGNGTTEEHFIWYLGEDISIASFTYTLDLVGSQAEPGTYTAYTNQFATLYPHGGDEIDFPRPDVEYEVIQTLTTVSGSKTWDDSNNQDGKRPESIIVNLFANGVQVDSKTVTEADGWAWTFADLDKYADGVEILYTISEEPVEGYIPTINGYDITNSYEPEQTYVSGRKIWNDDNNRDGVRPDSIVIRLWADGVQIDSKVVTAADAWAWYFFDLDKYQNGREIDYTITEDPVPGYTTTIAYGVVTNTYIPETTSIPVSKVWNDNNNQDGVRPNSITVTLLADGVDTGLSVVLSAVNGWKSAFTDLPRYENNAEINYSVVESSVEGYVSTITGNAANGFEIINSRETAKITVSGTKTWIDNDNETGIRPESITINLHANGAVIASKTVSEADGWAWTFADLDMYADGKEIAYTITENVVDGYMTEVHGYDVINYLTETPEDFEEFEEIEDEDVPLASPQTADVASLWAVSALVSGGAVKFIRRKKRYEDD